MGAGTDAASVGIAGHVDTGRPQPFSPTMRAAAYFDPATGGFALVADGQMQGTHPVDQAVALCLLPLGSLLSVPDTGLDVWRIKRASAKVVGSVVLAAVQQALQPLIDVEDIGSLTVASVAQGSGVAWVVSYENLRMPKTERAPVLQEIRLLPRR